MGKKNKGELPNSSNITNRDILQRLNFLYQASVYVDSISRKCGGSVDTAAAGPPASDPGPSIDMMAVGEVAPSSTVSPSKATRRKRDWDQRKGRTIRAADIGQGYVRAMRVIGQKTTVKMRVIFRLLTRCCWSNTYIIRDPTVKRTLCRGCDTVLIPGLSATVRVNSAWFFSRVVLTQLRFMILQI